MYAKSVTFILLVFMRELSNKIDTRISNATQIDVDLNTGLKDKDVELRIEEGLTNKSPKRVTKSYFRIFIDNFLNFFNILLFIIGAFLLLAQVGFDDISDIKYYFFLIILFANIFIGFGQDVHARKLVDKLKVVSSPTAIALRNGKSIELSSNDLVLSDIVILKTGDQIVADAIVVEGFLEVNESLLTGESVDVKKPVGSTVFSGSYVTSGKAKVQIVKVGKANYAEKLQDQAKAFKRPKSEIIKSLNNIFKVIGGTVIVFGIALVITFVSQSKIIYPFYSEVSQESIKQIAGSLVSMIPTGMYLLTSTTLALGVIRLARRRMLVQELYCIEMLARVDVLCLDKTGTLTDGTMKVSDILPFSKVSKEELKKILISIVKGTKDTNSTANAINDAFKDNESFKVVKSFPFNSAKKMSMIQSDNGYTYVLGAREFVPFKNEAVNKKCAEHEANAERVLVVGRTSKPVTGFDDLPTFDIVGIVLLEDHIKDDAYENIKWFKDNGVHIKIISGDNALSVSKIAQKVGVENADKYISLEAMPLDEVAKIASNYTVFGRVSPEQKEALVSALRAEKHTVAMTGDGVNDILALKSADCSIAMASGSAAARNVAHLVSLESNFSTLPQVVAEGRRVINNLQRTCALFLVKTTFAVLVTLVCLIRAWSYPGVNIFPFVTPNLFVWEFATIGVSSLFLSFQPNDERLSGGFVVNILKKAAPNGLTVVLVTLSILAISWANPEFLSNDGAITLATLAFTAYSFVVLFQICRPFDVFRIVLFIGVVLVSSLAIFLDAVILPTKLVNGVSTSFILALNYNVLSQSGFPWWIGMIVFGSSIPVCIGLTFLTRKLFDLLIKYHEKELMNL